MKKIMVFVSALLLCTLAHTEWSQTAKKTLPTVVKVYTNGHHVGSGVVVTSKGTILTVGHLFDFPEQVATVRVYPGLDNYAVKLSHMSRSRDLAILEPVLDNRKYNNYLNLARAISVGESVMTIGCPTGYDWTVTAGIVSYLNRMNMRFTGLLQSDTPINPGNSGGPLVNKKGEIVGLASMTYSDQMRYQGLNFFVSVQSIRQFLNEIKYKGIE